MKTISITETDLLDGIHELKRICLNGQPKERELQNVVMTVFRKGMFKGLQYSGAIVIEDEFTQNIFQKLWKKLKTLFKEKQNGSSTD